MAKDRSDCILLKGCLHSVEGVSSVAMPTGVLVEFGGVNDFTLAGADSRGVLRITRENDLVGKTIDDSYAEGEQVYTHVPVSGDILQLRIPAGQAAISRGDLLARGVNGLLVPVDPDGVAVAEAEENLDNSGSSETALINARII